MTADKIDALEPLRGENISGLIFGRLTVLSFAGIAKSERTRRKIWKCRCRCGKEPFIAQEALQKGRTVSCGCYSSEMRGTWSVTHGLTRGDRHPIHAIWKAMVRRCTNPKDKSWRWYGARGVTVCDRWEQSFVAFAADMLPTWKRGLWLERKDNNKGYTKDNTKWETIINQANNKRDTIRFEHVGTMKTALELSLLSGMPRKTIYRRIHLLGWSVDRAISTPIKFNLRRNHTQPSLPLGHHTDSPDL